MSYEKSLQGFSDGMDKAINKITEPSFLGRNYCPACQNYLSDDEELILKKDWAYDMVEVKNPRTGKNLEVMCTTCHDEWTNELTSKYVEPEYNYYVDDYEE